jgi:hypothetical protein
MPKHKIADQIDHARLILTAAQATPELHARLAQVSYDVAALQEGQALYDSCVGARMTTYSARGQQLAATATIKRLREQVETQYSGLAQIARTAFGADVEALTALGLRVAPHAPSAGDAPAPVPPEPSTRSRSKSQAATLDRVRLLYDGAMGNPALQAVLTTLDYPPARLARERADVTALEIADVAQEGQKAAAIAHTAKQRAALAALQEWLSRFSGIVTSALRDRPDLLRAMGLKPRSR